MEEEHKDFNLFASLFHVTALMMPYGVNSSLVVDSRCSTKIIPIHRPILTTSPIIFFTFLRHSTVICFHVMVKREATVSSHFPASLHFDDTKARNSLATLNDNCI